MVLVCVRCHGNDTEPADVDMENSVGSQPYVFCEEIPEIAREVGN